MFDGTLKKINVFFGIDDTCVDRSVNYGIFIIAIAILDRLVRHSTVIKITGPSYRIKDLIEASK